MSLFPTTVAVRTMQEARAELLTIASEERYLTARTKYYDIVPKGHEANLDFREWLVWWANKSKLHRSVLTYIFKHDLLAFINSCCWIFEPRPKPVDLPFITWSFQDRLMLEVDAAIGSHDLVIEKTRDMGASWCALAVFYWRWRFWGRYGFKVLSRKEEYVDASGDPDSLFWKLDFLRLKSPKWLQAPTDRTLMHMEQLHSGAVIDGESTNKFATTGGRRTAMLFDEFSKIDPPIQDTIFTGTRDVTPCRLFIFTPQGTGNTAYEIAHDTKFRKISLHWTVHPHKAKGLYLADQATGGAYSLCGKKPRSPWYDEQCKRAIHPRQIAQELDLDYLGSDYQFFQPSAIDRGNASCCPAYAVGVLPPDPHTARPTSFIQQDRGQLQLWVLTPEGRPPNDRKYVVGVDISSGAATDDRRSASNSVICIVDTQTCEQVAEFADNNMPPHKLARHAVAMAKWFTGIDGQPAFMIWEASGAAGITFGREVIELGFRNFFWKRNEAAQAGRPTDTPGFFTTVDTKNSILADFHRAVGEGLFIVRSKALMEEAQQYIFTKGGKIEHSQQLRSADLSVAGKNHGDRVIAAALCVRGMRERPAVGPSDPSNEPSVHSYAGRRKAYEARHLRRSEW